MVTTIQFQAVVTYPNKKPAVGVRVLMAANFTRGRDKSMEVIQKFDRGSPSSVDKTDQNGEVDFVIDTRLNYHLIVIKVEKGFWVFPHYCALFVPLYLFKYSIFPMFLRF